MRLSPNGSQPSPCRFMFSPTVATPRVSRTCTAGLAVKGGTAGATLIRAPVFQAIPLPFNTHGSCSSLTIITCPCESTPSTLSTRPGCNQLGLSLLACSDFVATEEKAS